MTDESGADFPRCRKAVATSLLLLLLLRLWLELPAAAADAAGTEEEAALQEAARCGCTRAAGCDMQCSSVR